MLAEQALLSIVIPVFRDSARAAEAVDAILLQTLPEGVQREVIVVDDGSGDETAERLANRFDSRLRILLLPENLGRSGARNAGAAEASGKFLVFMDCDCLPGPRFLQAHLDALSAGAVACVGHVSGDGQGFWDRYQTTASSRRSRQHCSDMPYAGSSQNLAVQREVFETVGGFDVGYTHYGFEDRDLLLRLARQGTVAWSDGARVSHMDTLTLSGVASKLAEAGEYSSQRFMQHHPDAYLRLGYARIDARAHPVVAGLAPLLGWTSSRSAAAFDWLRCKAWLPYTLASGMVKAITAASYFAGTARRT